MSIASGTQITAENHAEWLAVRQETVGASESASLLGVGYDTDLAIYLRKLGLAPPPEENLAMRLGKLLEPIVALLYREETGCEFAAEQLFLRSTAHPWMSATLDYVRLDGRPLEIKTVGARSAHLWGESETDEVPPHCIVQVTHQMVVSGTEAVDVAALIAGSELRCYTVHRDDDIAARIIDVTGEFMDRVRRRDPPPPDYGRDVRSMAALYPRAEGAMELDPVGLALAEEWEEIGKEVRGRQEHRERIKCELLSILGERATAKLADGRVLSRRVVDVAERTVTQRGYSYSDLRILRGA